MQAYKKKGIKIQNKKVQKYKGYYDHSLKKFMWIVLRQFLKNKNSLKNKLDSFKSITCVFIKSEARFWVTNFLLKSIWPK